MRLGMRRWMRAVVVMAVMGTAVAMRAQITDPSTGMTVDVASDPVDYADVMSGQPGNIGTEAAAQAQETFAAMDAQVAAVQALNDSLMNTLTANQDNSSNDAPAAPAIPRTPEPKMTPNGGHFKGGSVQVTITDADPQAKVMVSTDGKTFVSYSGPITVTGTEKVKAMALADGENASKTLAKAFKVKA